MLQARTPSACFGQLVCFNSNDNKSNTNEVF